MRLKRPEGTNKFQTSKPIPTGEGIDEAPLASVLSRRYVYIFIRVLFGDYKDKDIGGRRSGRNEKAEGEEDVIARLEAPVI